MTFQDIIDGKGAFKEFELSTGPYLHKEEAKHIVCADGTEISVQASRTHYCTPRSDYGPYTKVQVGDPTALPPDTWAEYAGGAYPNVDVYGYVPVELVREFIEIHGGETAEETHGNQ